MGYVVLARKWRPLFFRDMVGQEHIAQTLTNALKSGKISHGFLFTGTRGVGKTSAARILARALNCSDSKEAEPCGECANCQGISSGQFMDVLEIDGASNRGVDDIRELREQVKYATMQGRYKVYIIDEVHMLTKEAFNALLKTLEEPPGHVIFIFATTEVRKVPQTILSRVQRFDFKRISTRNIIDRLGYICSQESISAEPEALQLVAERGNGSMRDSLSFLDQVYAHSGQDITGDIVRKILGIPSTDLFIKLFQAIKDHNKTAAFKALEEFYHQGIDISEILSGFGQFIRNILFSYEADLSAEDLGVGSELLSTFPELRSGLEEGDILRYAKILTEILGDIKSAANPELILEIGIARMSALDRVVKISDLINSVSNSAEVPPEKKKDSLNPSALKSPGEPAPMGISPNLEAPGISQAFDGPAKAPPAKNAHNGAKKAASKKSGLPSLQDQETEITLTKSEIKFIWNQIVKSMIKSRPLVGHYFEETELVLVAEKANSRIEIIFEKEARYHFVNGDKSLVKFVKTKLSEKIPDTEKWPLELSLDSPPDRKIPGAGDLVPPEGQSSQSLSEHQWIEKAPIIGYVMETFEGSILG